MNIFYRKFGWTKWNIHAEFTCTRDLHSVCETLKPIWWSPHLVLFLSTETASISLLTPTFMYLRTTWKDKLKPRLRASEYAKSLFANFRMKMNTDNPRHHANEYARGSVTNYCANTDKRIYGRVNVSMDNLGKQNHDHFTPRVCLKLLCQL
jgi:hypothetical protein